MLQKTWGFLSQQEHWVFLSDLWFLRQSRSISAWKKCRLLENQAECDDMKDELLDRFGEIPAAVQNLFRISMIRVQAHKLFITEVKGKNGEIRFTLKPDAKIRAQQIPELLKKQEKLTFNYKMLCFLKRYKKCGMVEKDAQKLLNLTEELLKAMQEELL